MIARYPTIFKSNGGRESFSKTKLFRSLKRSGLSSQQSKIITNKVAREIAEGFKTRDIYHKTLKLVKETSPHAAIQYSLKRALFDLGPTGHHFETFVARYFDAKGYLTSTCKIMKGKLVSHEVDVVAVKKGKLSLVECKFHNRAGIKNDIKIALYVKARRDDLLEGPEGSTIEHFFLASNTAFSLDAMAYAEGSNLTLLGVNAPAKKTFFEDIKELRLYPVTSLKSLTKKQKKILLEENLVVASDLKGRTSLLAQLGMSAPEQDRVMEEIELMERR